MSCLKLMQIESLVHIIQSLMNNWQNTHSLWECKYWDYYDCMHKGLYA
jgi:hypothetical protein